MRSTMRTLVAIVAAVIAASSARAENEYDMAHTRPLASGNGSDPFFTPCTHPYTGEAGYCLYTSQDMGLKRTNRDDFTGTGPFYMGYTRVFFSRDGVSWQDEGIVATESQFIDAKWVQPGSFHFWAPCLYTESGSSTTYRLYVPDVPNGDGGQFHFNGQIGEFTSISPFGPFTYKGTVSRATHHMSDPEVFPKGTDTSATGGVRYLLWADGDGAACGGLSIGPMTDDLTVGSRSEGYRISFSNLKDMTDELGTCSVDTRLKPPSGYKIDPFAGPYLEGPSLYDLPNELPSLGNLTDKNGVTMKYMLLFPSKPSKVPAACNNASGTPSEGEPNTANQVIAYALSNNVMGPYEYEGIVMCGSAKEWTNHMNMGQIKTPSGSGRPILYYHDSPLDGDYPHRKLLGECVYSVDRTNGKGGKQIALIDRDTRDGLSWCTSNSPVFALRASSGKYVQENSYDVPSGTNGGFLRVRSTRLGVWEQFTTTPIPNTNPQQYAIQARLTRQYVSAYQSDDYRLSASRDAIRDWDGERFLIVNNSDSTVSLQVVNNSKWVRVNGDRVVADQSSKSGAEKFKMVFLWDN